MKMSVFGDKGPQICLSQKHTHLQGIRLGKVCSTAHSHGDPDVNHLCGDVTEGQVTDHHFLRHISFVQADVTSCRKRRPRQLKRDEKLKHVEKQRTVVLHALCMSVCTCDPHIVMTQHDPLRLAGGSRCVDKRAALIGLLELDDVIKLSVRLIATQFHKLLPL